MLFSGRDSFEIDGVGFVKVMGSGSSCESTSKQLDVKNNFLLFDIFGEIGAEEEEERFLLVEFFFFYCATDQFPDDEFSMVTSWLSTDWLMLTEVETFFRRAGCSLVMLDLVLAKFVFLFLYVDVDWGIIMILR